MNWKTLKAGFAVSVIAVTVMVTAAPSASAMNFFGGEKADIGDLFVIDSLFNDSQDGRILTSGGTNLGDLFILDQLFNDDEATPPVVTPPVVTPPVTPTPTPLSLAQQLSGRILIQVENNGEAWYVNPVNNRRVYLGTPSQHIARISGVSLGISNADFAALGTSGVPNRLVGRFLIKTQDDGRIFYVNPANRQLVEINNGAEAENLIEQVGLGITNSNIAKITVAN